MQSDHPIAPLSSLAAERRQSSRVTPYRGIVTPLVTPLTDRDVLDRAGLERLIEHELAGGVHGLFLLGTTGEASALSGALRRDFVKAATEHVNRRVPILVGVSDTSVVESLKLARDVADMGADAIVVTTPYYLPMEQGELIEYARTFDRESPLPVFLYNMPRLTKVWFSLETLQQAMQFKNVVGVKDSSGDMEYFKKLCDLAAERPDWSLLIGSETSLADAVAIGADGGVTGGANVAPAVFAELYEAAVRADHSRVTELQKSLQIVKNIYQFGEFAAGTIRGIKCALELMGVCSGRMADPNRVCDAPQRKVVEEQLVKLGLLNEQSYHKASFAAPVV
jgi:4-hydroxy-tetrahydrodipicolinate synthase